MRRALLLAITLVALVASVPQEMAAHHRPWHKPTATVSPSPTIAPTVTHTATPTPFPTPAPYSPEKQALFDGINAYRLASGVNALAAHAILNSSAQWKSDDMAANIYVGHIDSLGRDPAALMTAFGYTFNTNKGENVAGGYTTVQAVLDAWKQSPTHNALLVFGGYRSIGLGRAEVTTGFRYYWAAHFGGV